MNPFSRRRRCEDVLFIWNHRLWKNPVSQTENRHVCGIVDWDSDPDTLPSFKIYTNCGIVIRVSQEDDASGFASVIKDPAVSQGLQNDFFIMINSLQYIIGAVG